jgi:hypothetical protein
MRVRRICSLGCFGAVLLCGLFAASAADAYTLKSSEGGFSAEFKAEPAFKKLEEKASSGPYARYQWLLDQGAYAWIVTYNDYPAGTIEKTGLQHAYQHAVDGGIRGVNGRMQSNNPVSNSGIAGRESTVFIPKGNLIMRQRIFIKGDRLYQNIYVGPPGSEKGKDVEDFFASFRLVN